MSPKITAKEGGRWADPRGIKSIPLIKRATGGGSRVKNFNSKGVLNQRFGKEVF